MNRLLHRLVALLCAMACAAVAGVSAYPAIRRVTTEDRNADGRPDMWRAYVDPAGQTEVDIDSNFDGRPDVQEYYEHGALIRRESDRNFDDRVDLVEEFDTVTQQPLRAVVDVDYDGAADLLVLFRDGRPVFSTYAPPSRQRVPAVTTGARILPLPQRRRHLAPLTDPFRFDASIRVPQCTTARVDGAVLLTDGGLPPPIVEASAPVEIAAVVGGADAPTAVLVRLAAPPRAPPFS